MRFTRGCPLSSVKKLKGGIFLNANVPIWEKPFLTVMEATEYFNIGEKKIRWLVAQNKGSDYEFFINNGNKLLIKRNQFTEFLEQVTSI